MNWPSYRYFLLFVAVALLLADAFEVVCAARRGYRGGGYRGGSRRTGNSRSGNSGSGSAPSKPRVSPNTPITASTHGSPIIRNQLSSRTSFRRVLVGGAVTYAALRTAPVYGGYYPMFYRSRVYVPHNRAIRMQKEEVRVTDMYGKDCVNPSDYPNGYQYDLNNDKYYNKSQITVQYASTKESSQNESFTLDGQKTGENITITSESDYNEPIIPGTNCTRVIVTSEVTIVEMYESNPNAKGSRTVQGSVAAAFLLPLLLELLRRWCY